MASRLSSSPRISRGRLPSDPPRKPACPGRSAARPECRRLRTDRNPRCAADPGSFQSLENAVEKRHAEQPPDRTAVGLGGANEPGELPVELILLGDDPGKDAARRRRWRPFRRAPSRHSERIALRQNDIEQACNQQDRRNVNDKRGSPTIHALPGARVTDTSPGSCWHTWRPSCLDPPAASRCSPRSRPRATSRSCIAPARRPPSPGPYRRN